MNTTTTTDHNRDHRSPDAIERDIKRTQDEMSRTVNKLGDQFTARNLVNALFDKAEDNDIEARWFYEGARRNPLALGLISAGAIWLVSDRDAKLPSFGSSADGQDKGDNLSLLGEDQDRDHRAYLEHMNRIERRDNEDHEAYQRRRDDARASYLMIERRHEEDDRSYRDRLDEATESMRRKRHEMADSARRRRDAAMEKVRGTGSRIGEGSRRTAERASGLYQDNPLIGGALAALVGLIAGSAAPATRSERRLMGEHARGSLDHAKQQAQGLADKAHDKKDAAVDKAQRMADPDQRGSKGRNRDTADPSRQRRDEAAMHR
ncbi:MAG: DUF3618 domain-containing protein [Erythrobacter sp.]|jgi:ElaB/YqjD/DUF883 family membrane-anchored ribosome-binding protein|nr:DUF3618 domain-containing protein [Erythrobacter sp.]